MRSAELTRREDRDSPCFCAATSISWASCRSLPANQVQASETKSRHHRQEGRTLLWVPQDRKPGRTWFSISSSRATASPHRTTVLAVLLPAYSTATRRSVAGRAPCGRGRRTPSASARGQRSTTSAWIAPTCVVSVVSLYQAGGPSTARGIAGSPRKQEDEATPAHKGPAAIVSSRRKILACGMRRSSEQGT